MFTGVRAVERMGLMRQMRLMGERQGRRFRLQTENLRNLCNLRMIPLHIDHCALICGSRGNRSFGDSTGIGELLHVPAEID
jgi:hypothetical protein